MKVAAWLVPSQPGHHRLASVIRALASRLGTHSFQPHITLCAGECGASNMEAMATRVAAAVRGPVPLTVASIGNSDDYYRCLFVEFVAGSEVLELRAAALREIGPDAREFRPHVSLLYAELEAEARAHLAAEMASLALPEMAGAVIEVVETGAGLEQWRTLARIALPSAPPVRGFG